MLAFFWPIRRDQACPAMRREANIPLFLWITTAVVVAPAVERRRRSGREGPRSALGHPRFARSVQNHVRGVGVPVEVSLLDDEQKEPEKEIAKDEPNKPDEAKPPEQQNAEKDDPEAKKKLPEKEQVKPDQSRAAAAPRAEEAGREKAGGKKGGAHARATDHRRLPNSPCPRRFAVKQVVEDDKQPDNPNAAFIADQANHVLQETQARSPAPTRTTPSRHPVVSTRAPTNRLGMPTTRASCSPKIGRAQGRGTVREARF